MEEETTQTSSSDTRKLFNVPGGTPAQMRGSNLVIAGVLIGLGILLLVGQLLHVRLERFLWPLFILVPGVALLLIGLGSKAKGGEGLTIAGTIVTVVGSLLMYQNLTNHWQSWAYAWALVGPTGAGLGQLIYGSLRGQPKAVKSGLGTMRVGLIMFGVGFVFFELVIGISGFGLGNIGWPVAIIGAGLAMVIFTLIPRRGRQTGE